jgi:hypothetical protein
MNNIVIQKIHSAIFLTLAVAMVALFGGAQTASAQVPSVSTFPASEITSTSMVFSGVISSTGYKSTTAWFEYGISPNGLDQTTGLSMVSQQPENRGLVVRNLTPNTTYYYRMVAENSIGITRGQMQTAKTLVTDPVPQNTQNTNTGATGFGLFSGNNTSSAANTGTTTTSTHTSSSTGTSSNNTNSSESIQQNIIGESKNMRLSIENGVDTVFPGETFTYRIVYTNKLNTDLHSGKLTIVIPEGFEILSFSKGLHEPKSSIIVVQLGTIEAKTTDEITVLVRATSGVIRNTYVVATAEMTVAVGSGQTVDSVRARDVDTYGSGSSLGLGASAAGSGRSLPRTLFGWLLVAIVFVIIVVGARMMMKRKQLQSRSQVSYNPEDLN